VPQFPLFAKSNVNGKGENEIYTFLKAHCCSPIGKFSDRSKLLYNPLHANDIRWNFEKFLINKNGFPYRRFAESVDPLKLAKDIRFLLSKKGGSQ